jgi:hypothetical protein
MEIIHMLRWEDTFKLQYGLQEVKEMTRDEVVVLGFIPDKEYYLYFSAKNKAGEDMVLALYDLGGWLYHIIEIYDLMSANSNVVYCEIA